MRKYALCLLGLVVASLVALGLVVLFTASEVRSGRVSGTPWYFVTRQVMYIGVGLVLAFIVAKIDYRSWREYWPMTAVLGIALLVSLLAVFLFPATKGSHRWIPLPGGINFQPAEMAKLATVLLVAVCIDKAGWRIELFKRGAIYPVLIIAMFAAPVIKQPDFGSAMVIGIVGFMLMFVGGTRLWHMVPFVCGGVGAFVWYLIHNPNRMARIFAFVGTEAAQGAENDAAYQAGMSIVAIKRGGIFGVGLSRSMQKQNFLPEAWTDFIFAIGAEELGLIFSVATILLYLAFFFLSVYIAAKAKDAFGKLVALGMSAIIFFQAMFNIGVVCEAYPTKGMALPFFSYGGTNMIASLIAVGFIFSVGRHSLSESGRNFMRKIVAN